MHDEACSHYVSMVDQTTLGHRFLLSELGYVPRAGWQIDPFGHSSTQAALLSAAVGFDSLFFARIDYEDRRQRKSSKTMEFVWQASSSLGGSSRVWTSVLDPDYGPLAGFCFDEELRCPLQQDMRDSVFWNNTQVCDSAMPLLLVEHQLLVAAWLPLHRHSNSQARVDEFVSRVQEKAKSYQGDHIMLPMGSDFMYRDAHRWWTLPLVARCSGDPSLLSAVAGTATWTG
jgi:alpha-mannosidase